MQLPEDMQRFKASDYEPEDPFQLLSPADAGLALACIAAFCAIFWPYFK